MTIGRKIKILRLDKHMTQFEFGRQLGWADSRVGCYERNERKPTKRSLEKIAMTFNIKYDDLVKDTDMDESSKYCASNDGYEVEYCNVCESEIELRWDINLDGFQAICPICGSRLMLCDACFHRFGKYYDDCNYNPETDKCRFSKPADWWRKENAEEEKR